jgi:hypothetical protein
MLLHGPGAICFAWRKSLYGSRKYWTTCCLNLQIYQKHVSITYCPQLLLKRIIYKGMVKPFFCFVGYTSTNIIFWNAWSSSESFASVVRSSCYLHVVGMAGCVVLWSCTLGGRGAWPTTWHQYTTLQASYSKRRYHLFGWTNQCQPAVNLVTAVSCKGEGRSHRLDTCPRQDSWVATIVGWVASTGGTKSTLIYIYIDTHILLCSRL